VDGDPNRSATGWGRHGKLPFTIIDECQAARHARNFEHIIIDTKARPEEEDLKALADILAAREEAPAQETAPVAAMPPAQPMAADVPPPARPRGRPREGKRSNADYEQTTAYVRRTTYRDVKIALLQDGDDRDYSELVEELLTQWLQARG